MKSHSRLSLVPRLVLLLALFAQGHALAAQAAGEAGEEALQRSLAAVAVLRERVSASGGRALEPDEAAGLRRLIQSVADDLHDGGPLQRDLYPEALRLLGRHEFAQGNLDEAVEAYTQAMDFWAVDRRIEFAGQRYLDVFRELALAAVRVDRPLVPAQVLEDVLKITQSEEDRALAHYLAALALSNDPDLQQRARAGAEFERARGLPLPEAQDALLLHYAKWAEASGFSSFGESGAVVVEPDFETALKLYQELESGGGRYAETAREAIRRIRQPDLAVRVPNTFRPGTQVQVILSWRNAQQVDVSLVPVRLIDVINPPATAEGDWIGTLQPRKGEPLRRQQLTAPEARPYYAVTRVARFDESLPAGAYVVVARAGDLEKRSLLLVTESALVLKATSTQALLYACSSVTGAPIAGATLVLWTRPADSDGAWSAHPASTGSEGMVLLDLAAAAGGPMERDIVAAMYSGEQQAYVTHFPGSGEAVATEDRWNFAVFPDKSVYRLGEEIRWLVVARKDVPQAASRMPDGEELRFRLLGPDDYELSSGTLRTNAYGTAWSSVSLPAPAFADRADRTRAAQQEPPVPLGNYRLQLFRSDDGEPVHETYLCRVEQELSPDYRVAISRDMGDNGPSIRVGETVRGSVQVEYTYGGVAANVPVQLTVYGREYNANEDLNPPVFQAQEDAVVSRQTLRTDSRGQATYSFQTPASTELDFHYVVEASVTEPSGQLNTAYARAYATRQDHYVTLETARRLYEPGQAVRIELRSHAPDGTPEQHAGTLRVLRERWQETWVDRRGREISGVEMRELRKSGGGWFFGPSPEDYRLKSEGYATEEVTSVRLETDAQGRLVHEWQPNRSGFYRLEWVGEGERGRTVWSEASVWVASTATEDVGYRPESIELLTNEEPTRSVEGVPLLVTVPLPEQYVLLTTGMDRIDSWRLLKMAGTSQLVKVADAGNRSATRVEATYVSGERIDSASLVMAGAEPQAALRVDLEAMSNDFSPGEAASWTIRVTGADGRPVPDAQVTFSVADRAALAPLDRARLAQLSPPNAPAGGMVTRWTGGERPFFHPLEAEPPAGDAVAGRSAGPAVAGGELSAGYTTPWTALSSAPTAVWLPELKTGPDGAVTVDAVLPASLTTWYARVLALAPDGRSAIARGVVETRQPVTMNLRHPQQVVAGDRFDVVAQLRNNSGQARRVRGLLTLAGPVEAAPGLTFLETTVAPNESALLRWSVIARAAGEASFTALLSGDGVKLSEERSMPVAPDPRETCLEVNAFLEEGSVPLPRVPEGAARTEWSFQATPSLARMALDALPSVVGDLREPNPETASMVGGTAIVRGGLVSMRHGEEPIVRALATHGLQVSPAELLRQGTLDLRASQSPSGGWGWTPGSEPDDFISGYVTCMLSQVDGERTVDALLSSARAHVAERLLAEEQGDDARAWLLYALSVRSGDGGRPSRIEARTLASLTRTRQSMDAFPLACMALAAANYGLVDETRAILADLRALALPGRYPDGPTLHWASSDWPAEAPLSEVEMSALALSAMAAIDPADPAVQPTLRFLLHKRRENHWNGHRETTLVLSALMRIAAASGEIDTAASLRCGIGGAALDIIAVNPESSLSTPGWRPIPEGIASGASLLDLDAIHPGSPVAVSTRVCYLADALGAGADAPRADLDIEREYLFSQQAPTLLRGFVEQTVAAGARTVLHVGDRVEAVLRLKVARDLRFVTVEDQRPGCLDYVRKIGLQTAPLLNTVTGEVIEVRVERLRHSTAYYVDSLPAGSWELRYAMRVENSGTYSAPPATAWLAPNPDARAVSEANVLVVEAAQP